MDGELNIAESTIDISEFGAEGDGSTDDTAAIQSALDYLEEHGGTLNLESRKTYNVTEGLLLRDAANFKIEGNGATIKVADDAAPESNSTEEGGPALRVEDASDFAIDDLAIDDSGASAEGSATIEIADGENFYLSETSSINFENIGGPAVNLSVLAAADADLANADSQVESEAAAGSGEADESGQAGAETEINSASEDSDADDALASDETSTDGAVAMDDGETLDQSLSSLLAGKTGTETLDFSSLGDEGAVDESGGAEDQLPFEAAGEGDLATATDDTTVTSESGQDNVPLLGVTSHSTGDFDYATS